VAKGCTSLFLYKLYKITPLMQKKQSLAFEIVKILQRNIFLTASLKRQLLYLYNFLYSKSKSARLLKNTAEHAILNAALQSWLF
jgi:hypothetical protein